MVKSNVEKLKYIVGDDVSYINSMIPSVEMSISEKFTVKDIVKGTTVFESFDYHDSYNYILGFKEALIQINNLRK